MGITVLATWLPLLASDDCAELFKRSGFIFNGFGTPWLPGYNHADTLGITRPVSSEDCDRMQVFVAAYKKAVREGMELTGWMRTSGSDDTNKAGKTRLEKWLCEATAKVKLNAQFDKVISWDSLLAAMVAMGCQVSLPPWTLCFYLRVLVIPSC
jgi:hypothetical protein